MVGVFNWTRETVVMPLSEPARRMDVLFCAGSVTALRFDESRVRITITLRVRVSSTLAFFFRLRPLPPRLPRFVFLSRTLFFFFLGPMEGSAVSPIAVHCGRTPTEAVCSAPVNGADSEMAVLLDHRCGRTPSGESCSVPGTGSAISSLGLRHDGRLSLG